MLTFVAVVAIVCQLYFIYYIWTNLGITWALATLLIPFAVFYVAYVHWDEVKVPFLIQLVCYLIFVASGL